MILKTVTNITVDFRENRWNWIWDSCKVEFMCERYKSKFQLLDNFQAKSLVTNSVKLWLPVFQPKHDTCPLCVNFMHFVQITYRKSIKRETYSGMIFVPSFMPLRQLVDVLYVQHKTHAWCHPAVNKAVNSLCHDALTWLYIFSCIFIASPLQTL